ncbi:MAG: DUF6920 family protein [Bacillota bacterium]
MLKKISIIFFIIILLIVFIYLFSKKKMLNQVETERKNIVNNSNLYLNNEKYNKKDLPKNVYLWLENTGVFDSRRIKTIEFDQIGLMKLSSDQKDWWRPKASQIINVINPSFLWTVDLSMMPFINTKGRDLLYNGKGSMLIKIGYIFPIVNEKSGRKINESSLSRFLLELPWYPTAALEDYMTWESVDKYKAKGTLEYKDINVSGLFYFDEDYNLIKVEAKRYKEVDKDAIRKTCIGEVREYSKIDDLKIPTKIDVSWIENNKKFTWYKIELKDIEIDYQYEEFYD